MIKRVLFTVLAFVVFSGFSGIGGMNGVEQDVAHAADKIKFYNYANSLGAEGYDVVAYFGENGGSGDAVKGMQQYKAEYGGETWLFSSAANRDKFTAAPSRYIPHYGGHCAYGVAQGYLVRGDPEAWSVHKGVLYLNYNKNIRREWVSQKNAYLRRSEQNWPKLNN